MPAAPTILPARKTAGRPKTLLVFDFKKRVLQKNLEGETDPYTETDIIVKKKVVGWIEGPQRGETNRSWTVFLSIQDNTRACKYRFHELPGRWKSGAEARESLRAWAHLFTPTKFFPLYGKNSRRPKK